MTKEEAIEKVREMKLSPGKDAELIIALHTLIPELRESEDERIRKELIGMVKFHCADEHLDRYLNYLEKQKDASKAIEAVDRIDKYIDEHLANAHDMKDSNPDKKYYRGWDDALGKMTGILQDVYSDEKQKEQKPEERFEEAREKYQVEWSEEDETMRNNIIRVLSCFTGDVECESNPSLSTSYPIYTREISWLKSLRPSWKPSNLVTLKNTNDFSTLY